MVSDKRNEGGDVRIVEFGVGSTSSLYVYNDVRVHVVNSRTRQRRLSCLHQCSQNHTSHTGEAKGAQGTSTAGVVDGGADGRSGASRRSRAIRIGRGSGGDGEDGGVAGAGGMVEGCREVRVDACGGNLRDGDILGHRHSRSRGGVLGSGQQGQKRSCDDGLELHCDGGVLERGYGCEVDSRVLLSSSFTVRRRCNQYDLRLEARSLRLGNRCGMLILVLVLVGKCARVMRRGRVVVVVVGNVGD